MKRYITTALFTALCTASWAGIEVGYCDDEIKQSLYNSNVSAQVSAAMVLTSAELADYQACNIKEVQIGFYNPENIASLKVWVREHLNDTVNLAVVDVDLSNGNPFSAGWNTVELPTTIAIPDYDSLYVGYDYTQSVKSSKVIGASGKKNTANSCWVGLNGKWKDYKASYFPHCIRVGLGGMQPRLVKVETLKLDKRYQQTTTSDALITVSGVIRSMGYEPLTQFDVTGWDLANRAGGRINCNKAFGDTAHFAFQFYPRQQDKLNAVLEVLVDENRDTLYYEFMSPAQNGPWRTTKTLLVEQFTSLQNGFAPLGMQHLDEAVAAFKEQYPNEIEYLTLHQGYGPADSLRTASDFDYSARAVFGPEELSYAPAISINRTQTLSSTLPVDTLVEALTTRVADAAHSSLHVSATYFPSDHKLTATFEALTTAFTFFKNPTIMMLLVENQVQTAGSQRDYFDAATGYEKNVVRQCFGQATGFQIMMTSTGKQLSAAEREAIQNGTAPIQVGGSMSTSFELSMNDDFVPENYHVVAYLLDMDDVCRPIDSMTSQEISVVE